MADIKIGVARTPICCVENFDKIGFVRTREIFGSAGEVVETGKIFAYDVKFKVDASSGHKGVEVCVLVGVGYDGYAECVALGVAHGEAYTVDRNRAFFNSDISFSRHFGVNFIAELVVTAAVDLLDVFYHGGAVNVALHNVAVETTVENHAAFEIHF